ncbi:MAG: diacylglycerol kinase family protein [Sumerlaeia bacterium]
MKVTLILNGNSLRGKSDGLPQTLRSICENRGHRVRLGVSRSLPHFREMMRRAIAGRPDVILVGGGDGTFHHAINVPGAETVPMAPLPIGTINAFQRAAGLTALKPPDALRALLGGAIVEGWCGILADKRFACFASLGFDARAIHRNPLWLKDMMRAGSFLVTGTRLLASSVRDSCPGTLSFDRRDLRFPAASVLISKIQNYAGFSCFGASFEKPRLEAVFTATDSAKTLMQMASYLGARGPVYGDPVPNGLVHVRRFREARWRSPCPTLVQLDGEAILFEDTCRLKIGLDPRRQRYLVPAD